MTTADLDLMSLSVEECRTLRDQRSERTRGEFDHGFISFDQMVMRLLSGAIVCAEAVEVVWGPDGLAELKRQDAACTPAPQVIDTNYTDVLHSQLVEPSCLRTGGSFASCVRVPSPAGTLQGAESLATCSPQSKGCGIRPARESS